MTGANAQAVAEAVFRREYGRIVAGLIRISGSFDRAEEAMQEAFAAALASWRDKGIPQNPAAWITTTAQRKFIDSVRREQTRVAKEDAVAYESNKRQLESYPQEDDSMHLTDDRLRL